MSDSQTEGSPESELKDPKEQLKEAGDQFLQAVAGVFGAGATVLEVASGMIADVIRKIPDALSDQPRQG